MSLIDIKSMIEEELVREIEKLSEPKFRAKQVYNWLNKGVESFDEMRNLPLTLRNKLSEKYYIASAKIERKLVSKRDGTIKYLFRLFDDEFVESVLMKYKHGYSICISTQVGCKMGCKFCATGKSGFSRNLSASEMLAQIEKAQKDNNIRISNVVLMGMGEPLDNYDNVLRFLKLVSIPDGLNIGMRHISLSTCGIVPRIYDLADKKLQITLSVSLHAPDDSLRSQTMPINRKYNIEELIAACRYYLKKTGRRISFEYAMISGINDTDECANKLADKLNGMLCHVNLIPVNSSGNKDAGYARSSFGRIEKFSRILTKKGITVTVRRTLGSDINASCGQLRRANNKEEVRKA